MSIKALETAIIREAACRALGEDMGPIDLTSSALVSPESRSHARIFIKEPGILCGSPIAQRIFNELDPSLTCEALKQDGDTLHAQDTVLRLSGSTRAILTAERSALNILQHLSAIATETQRYVSAVAHTSCKILDTRKTMPGLRQLQKYAVRCGGGTNHRMGLYDAFMAKDNHVAIQPTEEGIREAVLKMRRFDPDVLLIFEADTLAQVQVLAQCQVDRILLDNMNCETLKQAVALVQGRCKLEASGNMTLARVKEVAETGVDYISVGALTHSVQALDFSLELITAE
jgi:nicotinate-nucleotide pyrophosphorylase (carboxylating)